MWLFGSTAEQWCLFGTADLCVNCSVFDSNVIMYEEENEFVYNQPGNIKWSKI